MPYIVETFDHPGSLPLRMQHRPAHLQFLEEHKALLIACGAKLHDDGSDLGGGVYVVDVADRAAAEAFIQRDPFFQAGLFASFKITRWRKAYVDGTCML